MPRGHRDCPAFDVLADILSAGRQSRLWQSLVEQEKLATWVEATARPGPAGGQFFIQVECAVKADPGDLERRIADILAEMVRTGRREQELARAESARSGLAMGAGRPGGSGRGDWPCRPLGPLARLAGRACRRDGASTPRQSSAVARSLTDDNLTSGWSSTPTRKSRRRLSARDELSKPRRCIARTEVSLACATTAGPTRWTPVQGLPAIKVPRDVVTGWLDYHPRRSRLENGLRVIHERRPETGVVALELHVDAGWIREEQPGASYLTGRLLEEGTRTPHGPGTGRRDRGCRRVDGGHFGLRVVRVRAEDLALALEIAGRPGAQPDFPAEAVDWAKQRILAELQADLEDPAQRADSVFRRLVYGQHPLGRDPRGSLARRPQSLTRERRRRPPCPALRGDRSFLVAVGDFEPRTLARLVKTHLGSWASAKKPAPPWPPVSGVSKPRVRRVEHPGEQVHIILGHLGIPRRHPDFEALVVLDHIFGTGPGFSDRLGRIVRDEMGLVYSIGGGITDSADLLPGLFRVYAGTMPEEAKRVVAVITDQVRAMHDGAFGGEEVDRALRYLASAFIFDFQTVEQRADRLFELERLGLTSTNPDAGPSELPGSLPLRSARPRGPTCSPRPCSEWNTDPLPRDDQSQAGNRPDRGDSATADARSNRLR